MMMMMLMVIMMTMVLLLSQGSRTGSLICGSPTRSAVASPLVVGMDVIWGLNNHQYYRGVPDLQLLHILSQSPTLISGVEP